MFDTKVALIVRDDLETWQRLNVVAFLATSIAPAAPDAMGEPYAVEYRLLSGSTSNCFYWSIEPHLKIGTPFGW